MRWSSGDYQIAPIAARSTAMGRWRLTPPGYWGGTACGRKLECFVPRHEYLSFFVKRKVPKKTTQTYGLRIPWRAMGHAKLAVLASRNWCGGGRCRFGGLLVPPAPLPLTTARVGAGALIVFGDYQIAPLPPQGGKGRCARRAQDIIIS